MRVLRGQLFTGSGNFSYWIQKLHDHYLRKTGLMLFPGTLNLKLNENFTCPQPCLRLEKEDYSGEVSVNLVPCTVFGRTAYILRTDKAEADPAEHRIIEIATDEKLRDAHGLHDGDSVDVWLE